MAMMKSLAALLATLARARFELELEKEPADRVTIEEEARIVVGWR